MLLLFCFMYDKLHKRSIFINKYKANYYTIKLATDRWHINALSRNITNFIFAYNFAKLQHILLNFWPDVSKHEHISFSYEMHVDFPNCSSLLTIHVV